MRSNTLDLLYTPHTFVYYVDTDLYGDNFDVGDLSINISKFAVNKLESVDMKCAFSGKDRFGDELKVPEDTTLKPFELWLFGKGKVPLPDGKLFYSILLAVDNRVTNLQSGELILKDV